LPNSVVNALAAADGVPVQVAVEGGAGHAEGVGDLLDGALAPISIRLSSLNPGLGDRAGGERGEVTDGLPDRDAVTRAGPFERP
jgi:hypothetical protein